jgi:hypothetical protein
MSIKEMDSHRTTYNMNIRKIPLEPLIQILQDLFENGTDFIDISGEQNAEGEAPRDMIKISVKPEYMMDHDELNDENTIEFMEEEIEMDYTGSFEENIKRSIKNDITSFSDEDIDNLI